MDTKYEFNYNLDGNDLSIRLKNMDKPEPTICRTDDISKWSNYKNIDTADALMFAIHVLMSRLVYVEPSGAKLDPKEFYTVVYRFKGAFCCKFANFSSKKEIGDTVDDICNKLNLSLKDIEIRLIENTNEEAVNKYKNSAIYASYKGFLKKYLHFCVYQNDYDKWRYMSSSSIQEKYYFTFYNYIAQEQQMGFVIASSMYQAKQLAILYMRFYCGKDYNEDNIDNINRLDDSYFYSLGDIKAKYERRGKEFIMPDIAYTEEE